MLNPEYKSLDQLRADRKEIEGRFERFQTMLAEMQAGGDHRGDPLREHEYEGLTEAVELNALRLEHINEQIFLLEAANSALSR